MQGTLTFILHFVAATTLMGVFVIAALTAGYDTARPILIAAIAGYTISVPISWMIVRGLTKTVRGS